MVLQSASPNAFTSARGSLAVIESDDVSTPSLSFKRMAPTWQLPDALLAGTEGMRGLREFALPREPREKKAAYEARLRRSFLFNAYEDTVDGLAAKPFGRAISLKSGERLGRQLQMIEGNCDRRGRDLTTFARPLLHEGIHRGLSHIFVDFPRQARDTDAGTEMRTGVHPYFIHVSPKDLVGHAFEDINGTPFLRHLRIRERTVLPKGQYGQEEAEVIREYRFIHREEWLRARLFGEDLTGSVRLWKKGADDKEFTPMGDEEPFTFVGVPLATLYLRRTGQLEGEPVMEALAQLNCAHWQSLSDQRNLLRIARVPILFRKGVTDDEKRKGFSVGPTEAVDVGSKDADMKFVEHTGKAIEAGEKDLERLEERMEILGLRPLMRKTGGMTATGQALDAARSDSEAQAWVRNLEATLRLAYQHAARWLDPAAEDEDLLPSDFRTDIFSDFTLSKRAAEEVGKLITMREKKLITHKTFLTEVRKRGNLSEDLDIDNEVSELEDEAQKTAALFSFPGNDDTTEDDTTQVTEAA